MKIKKLHKDAILPRYSSEGASGFDLFAYQDIKWEMEDGFWTATIKTGWAFEVDKEHGMFLLSRSGQGFNHLTHLANCVGLLDWDFSKQCLVKLICLKSTPPEIKKGQAICQAVILETPRMFFYVVDKLENENMVHDGFGSTDEAKL